MKRKDIERLADYAYHPKDIAATISSGSYITEGMVIAPCSMKTLAAVGHAPPHDPVSRGAGGGLKERPRPVLAPRGAPPQPPHPPHMVAGPEEGGLIIPPTP